MTSTSPIDHNKEEFHDTSPNSQTQNDAKNNNSSAKNSKCCFKEYLHSRLETFLCHLYSIINIPRSLVQTFVELVKNLISDIALSLNESLNNDLTEITEKISVVQNMCVILQTLFKDLDTDYKRLKYFAGKGYYVEPIDVKIGTTKKRNKENNDITMMLQERKLYITPLRIVLKNFLELPGVYSDILNYEKSLFEDSNNGNKVIQNLTQGTLWQEIIAKKVKSQNEYTYITSNFIF